MHKKIIVFLLMAALLAPVISVGVVQAQGEDDQALISENFKQLLIKLDTSITSLRKGDTGAAMDLIKEASAIYDENFSSKEKIDNTELDDKITQAFASLSENLDQKSEENIFVLRADVSRAASLIGVSLSPIYAHSMFIIMGIAVVVSLIITLVTKRLVNWDQVRENKAKISEYLKEFRAAQSRRDMKQLHKLQQRQAEIRKLQGQVFTASFKPTIIYIIPLILLWTFLTGVYSGWVVAWLPFNIGIPIIAADGLVAFGVGWWYFLTYLGFSQIFRKILIRD